jgi:hypothetical protein
MAAPSAGALGGAGGGGLFSPTTSFLARFQARLAQHEAVMLGETGAAAAAPGRNGGALPAQPAPMPFLHAAALPPEMAGTN